MAWVDKVGKVAHTKAARAFAVFFLSAVVSEAILWPLELYIFRFPLDELTHVTVHLASFVVAFSEFLQFIRKLGSPLEDIIVAVVLNLFGIYMLRSSIIPSFLPSLVKISFGLLILVVDVYSIGQVVSGFGKRE